MLLLRRLFLKYMDRLLFTAGVVCFSIAQIYLFCRPILERDEPVEVDDAYGYILKSVEMQTCFFQDCPALNELRPQIFSDTNEINIANMRARQQHRLFSMYHPIYSVALLALHNMGMNWPQAYNTASFLGCLITVAGVAIFLLAIFGRGSAGLALIFLMTAILPGQGIHYMVPSSICLGIAFWVWVAAIQRNLKWGWATVAGCALLLGTHHIGVVYSVIVIVLYLASRADALAQRKTWIVPFAIGLLILGLQALIMFVEHPKFTNVAWPIPSGYDSLAVIGDNLGRLWKYYRYFSGSPTLFGGLFFAGLLLIPRRRRILLCSCLGAMVAVLGASSLHTLPGYEGTVAQRFFAAAALSLSGFPALAIRRMITLVLWHLRVLARRGARQSLGHPYRCAGKLAIFAGLLLILGVSALYGLYMIYTRSQDLFDLVPHIAARQNYKLDIMQVQRLLRETTPDDSVLYTTEVPLYFFLVHGALARKAVYYHAVRGTELETDFIHANRSLRHVVGMSPLASFRRNQHGSGLLLRPGDRLEIKFAKPQRGDAIFLRLAQGPFACRLFTANGDAAGEPMTLLADDGWQMPFKETLTPISRIELMASRNATAIISGLGLGECGELNWPWDQGAIFVLTTQKGCAEAMFATSQICPALKKPVRVIMDSGWTVLGRIEDNAESQPKAQNVNGR